MEYTVKRKAIQLLHYQQSSKRMDYLTLSVPVVLPLGPAEAVVVVVLDLRPLLLQLQEQQQQPELQVVELVQQLLVAVESPVLPVPVVLEVQLVQLEPVVLEVQSVQLEPAVVLAVPVVAIVVPVECTVVAVERVAGELRDFDIHSVQPVDKQQ